LTIKEKEKMDRDIVELRVYNEYTKDSIDAVDYGFNHMNATRKIKEMRMKRLEKEYK